ncbi:uncharacterized protein BJ171DRAFT_595652 [Polychytrium aggregatum]|uniref:uncharacterized protein n=1 Tax=Polychytrium aggregatum TaxID=110093 RepID=UPI0022FE8171|nr:uncharacterized protein BJ171DRAFT_595652 [Polychytrium aggregatum]KAI9208502.1 hypothetical protein BJ171DRAFT_595652 [Polychytrium aggregatum]
MTRLDECEDLNRTFLSCLEREGFIGKLLGRCNPALIAFKECSAYQMKIKIRQNHEQAKERNEGWQKANEAIGVKTFGFQSPKGDV